MKTRIFTPGDQTAFSKLSGDNNPLHTDGIAARRMLFGAAVVHGIHALLWSVDCALEDQEGNVELRHIEAVFSKPIRVGEEVGLAVRNDKTGSLRLELLAGGSFVAGIRLSLERRTGSDAADIKGCFPGLIPPQDVLEEELEATSGCLDLFLNREAAAEMFPNLTRCFSPQQIAVLLATSRLAGVFCPGLHSIYSELKLSKAAPNNVPDLRYEVTDHDRRFGLVHMKVAGPGMEGSVEAFRRPPPTKQGSFLALKSLVESGEFAGQRGLVVGGSRGLGEVAAKLLAGGGADIKITYHQGGEDARQIVEDIVSNGGIADCLYFDVLNPGLNPAQISEKNWIPTHLYYFATPFIFSGVKGRFSPPLFSKFCDYYVKGFIGTVNLLRDLGTRHIFYPSSVAVDEIPNDMGEYAAAKMAGQTLCAFLEKTDRRLTIFSPLFPRMATDQTVSISPVANLDPLETMLKSLRAFRVASISGG